MTRESAVEFAVKGKTAIFTINRPEVHNAINDVAMQNLEQLLARVKENEELRTLIVTGSGKVSFCAGGDLRYFAALTTRQSCIDMSLRMQQILEQLESGGLWSIAAINGQSLGGGCEILSACHYRIAVPEARFSFRQAPNGIITGWGGGRRILRLLGKSRALRLFLTGETIGAAEALQIGLIDEIADSSVLLERCLELAAGIAGHPGRAIRGFLHLARATGEMNEESLARFETETFANLWVDEAFRKVVARYRDE